MSLDAAENEHSALGNRVAAPNPNPRDQAMASETAAQLDAALAQLSERHRIVFVMARYQGMPYDEIGRALRIPVGTVKSRMNKAVGFLLDKLKDTT